MSVRVNKIELKNDRERQERRNTVSITKRGRNTETLHTYRIFCCVGHGYCDVFGVVYLLSVYNLIRLIHLQRVQERQRESARERECV